MYIEMHIVTLLNNTVLLMISGSRWHKCQLSIYVVVAAEIWVNCLCPTYPPPRSWWHPWPSVMSEAPPHSSRNIFTSSFHNFSFSFSFFVLACLETKIPGISPHPPPRPSSFFLLLLPLIASPLFALICPQYFALTGRGSFTARLASNSDLQLANVQQH